MNANCPFCQIECEPHKSNTNWYRCFKCNFFFKADGSELCFRPNTDKYLYWVFINFTIDQTEVICERNPKSVSDQEDMSYDPKKILTITHALKGVTPQNVHEKLKTLLLFS